MLCTRDTVKVTGLNVWVNGDHNHNGPEVEYVTDLHWITDLLTDENSSIIADQGLGAHPYYAWVKKKDPAQREKSGNRSLSELF